MDGWKINFVLSVISAASVMFLNRFKINRISSATDQKL